MSSDTKDYFEYLTKTRRIPLGRIQDKQELEYEELVFDLYLDILDFLREESDVLPEEPDVDPSWIRPIELAVAYAVGDYLKALKKAFVDARAFAYDKTIGEGVRMQKDETTIGQRARRERETDKMMMSGEIQRPKDTRTMEERMQASREERSAKRWERKHKQIPRDRSRMPEVPEKFLEDIAALQIRLNMIQEKYNFPGPVLNMMKYDFANFYSSMQPFDFQEYMDKYNYMFTESPGRDIELWLS